MAEVVSMAKGPEGTLGATKSWVAETTAGSSNFGINAITVYTGPFDPGAKAKVAEEMEFKNNGEVGANANLKFGVNTGSGWSIICDLSTSEVTKAGDCAYWGGYDPDADTKCSPFLGNWSCDSEPLGEVYYNMPDQYDATVNLAIKVWGADEDEPAWPSVGEAVLGGRRGWSVVTGEERDNTVYYVLGGLAIATAIIGAVAMRR